MIGNGLWVWAWSVEGRVGVVMITDNRRVEALRSVGRLLPLPLSLPLSLPERPRVAVVDNGSPDGTERSTARRYVG